MIQTGRTWTYGHMVDHVSTMLLAHIGTTIAITITLKAMLLERPAQLRVAFVRIDTSIAWLMVHLTRARSRADSAYRH